MADAGDIRDSARAWPLRQTVIEVTHGVGMHARPSVTFTRLARSFPCSIEISVDGSDIWISAKSIVKIMGARIRRGARLTLRADGPGADEAIAALTALIERGFDEEKKHGRSA